MVRTKNNEQIRSKQTAEYADADIDQLQNLINYIFEQNKMQQEMKNTWFGHFLVVIGSVSAFATLLLSLVNAEDMRQIIYIITGIAFFIVGIIGLFFLNVFLYQRANYWKNYKIMNELQIVLIEKITGKGYSYYYPQPPFQKRKRGADYYVGLLERLIVSICMAVSAILILIAFNVKIYYVAGIPTVLFFGLMWILSIHYRRFERKNKL